MTIEQLVANAAREIVNPLIGLLFSLALLLFLWGVFVFISNPDNEEKRRTGQRHILWGVIGMVVMFGVYGLLAFLSNTFGLDAINSSGQYIKRP